MTFIGLVFVVITCLKKINELEFIQFQHTE